MGILLIPGSIEILKLERPQEEKKKAHLNRGIRQYAQYAQQLR